MTSISLISYIFFLPIRVFFPQTLTIHRTAQGKSGDHFCSTLRHALTHSRTLNDYHSRTLNDCHSRTLNDYHSRTLNDYHSNIKWLSCIFNRTACIYQIATRWDLLPYWITIWMIEDVILIFVYVLDGLILGFCYSNLTLETDRLKLVPTIPLVLQDWPSVLVTPSHVISYGHTLTKTNLVSYRHNI